jgi:hypothetical protein
MDVYNIWCDLKPDVSDLIFSERVGAYLGHLKTQGLIESWRITRRKLGLGHPALGEFHLMIGVRDLAQLDAAFQRVAGRTEPVESFHFGKRGKSVGRRSFSCLPGLIEYDSLRMCRRYRPFPI